MLETSTILVIVLYVHNSLSEEAFCTLNGKKALHKVNEKFLSISIDPAVLLTGLNLRYRKKKHEQCVGVQKEAMSCQFMA